jgi:mono/diheme cytochrome c family protein
MTMKYSIVLIACLAMSSVVQAGMMGNGMMGGGMMGSPSTTPSEPPAKDSDPAIRKGYNLSQQYCVQCHAPPNPSQHTAAQWPAVVDRMQGYMTQFRKPLPTSAERQLIIDYLTKSESHHG